LKRIGIDFWNTILPLGLEKNKQLLNKWLRPIKNKSIVYATLWEPACLLCAKPRLKTMKKATIILTLLSLHSVMHSTAAIEQFVKFRCEDYYLTGKLILPESQSKVPVIVYIEGSGPNSPLDSTRSKWYESNFTSNLIKNHIGILYYNKRGIGGSDGKWYTLSLEDRAKETKAAIDFLKTDPRIDSDRIGILGHSQGGWIAQIMSSRYPRDICLAISVCGPATDVFSQVVNDYQSEYIIKGLDSLKANRKAIASTKRVFFLAKTLPIAPNLKQLKIIRNFDPQIYLSNIQSPLLMVFGEYDLLVYPEWSLERLKELYGKELPQKLTLYLVPSAGHGMAVKPEKFKGVPADQIKYSEEFHGFYINWIKRQMGLSL